MRHLLTICAESVVTDAATNRASVFNIVDEFVVPRLPIVLAKFSILFLVERVEGEPEDQNAIMVIRQGEVETIRNPISVTFRDKPRARITTVVQGLVIQTAGTLRTSLIDAENNELGFWEFPVVQTEPSVVQSEPPTAEEPITR